MPSLSSINRVLRKLKRKPTVDMKDEENDYSMMKEEATFSGNSKHESLAADDSLGLKFHWLSAFSYE